MKKYKRKQSLMSSCGLSIAIVLTMLIALVLWWLSDKKEIWSIGICISVSLFILLLFNVLPTTFKYAYTKKTINLFWFSIKYKELRYEDFSFICISNASYNNGYGYGAFCNIPMKYKIKDEKFFKKVVRPFLTLHKTYYPVCKVQKKMSSRELFMLDSENVYCLGVLWNDSLLELALYTSVPIYILEDVYLRFHEIFDSTFKELSLHNRIFVITNDGILRKF